MNDYEKAACDGCDLGYKLWNPDIEPEPEYCGNCEFMMLQNKR